ncbi:MAG: ABC-F family ATP-binding cassette domain-containing protein, partial [Lysobacterales bacterium]
MPPVSLSLSGLSMLSVHHLTKSYGILPVLQDITFNISAGERIGLIGPNGCGKSTLLRILAGLEKPDVGVVSFTRPGTRIGYLAQGFSLDPNLTLAEACASVSASALEASVADLAAALAVNPNDEALQSAYDAVLTQLSTFRPSPGNIPNPLGLAHLPPEQLVGQLSGGQKTRLMLARLLLDEPSLLLLDEPTNHLDIAMLEWLEDWLGNFPGAALIVSHDRTFLDRTVSGILDLDAATHSLRGYSGNYSAYIELFLHEREKQWEAYKDQEAEIRHMRQDINRTKQQSLHVERTTTSRQPGVRRIAKKVAKKALSREKKLHRYLESEERLEQPGESWQMKLDLSIPAHQSQNVLATDKLVVGYPGGEALLKNITMHIRP